MKFAFGTNTKGYVNVTMDQLYSKENGYGWLENKTNTFSINLPEGNYDVAIKYTNPKAAAESTVKVECSRLMLLHQEQVKDTTRQFTVNVKQPQIKGGDSVQLNSREKTGRFDSWNDCLTLEFFPDTNGIATLEIKPASKATTIYIAGDSTVTDNPHYPWSGWGQMIPSFFKPGISVANYAESGRALYSFRSEKRLAKILSEIKAGDYLFIQFGHNDQKDKSENAGPFTTYKTNLLDYVAKAREKGANPILVSPMERRRWKSGKPRETLSSYAEAVRQVSKEQNVPMIDLHAMSLTFYSTLGKSGSAKAFVHYPANTFKNQPKALKDNTHHSPYGAYELARCVVQGIMESVPELAKQLRENIDFDPANPDSYESISIPDMANPETLEKPEGN